MTDGPLIVQSDKTLLLEVAHPDAAACRASIAPFAELERSPEHVHTFRITPLALWNARAAGHDAEEAVDALVRWSRFPVAPCAARRCRRDDGPLRPPRPRIGRAPRTRPAHLDRPPCSRRSCGRSRWSPLVGVRIDDDTVARPQR